jgi:branched-chain amino acid transport system substrate-binding protein
MFPHNQLRRRGVMKNRLGQFFIVAVVAAFMVATGTAMAADTIKLGVAGPHSGDLASYGIPTIKAAELVVKDINAKGGVLGKQVELLVEDDVCKPEVATNTATKLVSRWRSCRGGPHLLRGHQSRVGHLQRLQHSGHVSRPPPIPALTQSGDYPNFFRTIASDDAQARLEVDFALDVLKLKKIAVLHDKGDYGKGLAEFAKAFLEADSRAEVVFYEGITPGAVDYSAVVQKIKKIRGGSGYFRRLPSRSLQNRSARCAIRAMDTVFISDDGVKDDTFIKVAR